MFFWNSSIKVSDSGLLKGYTDYHCHLLPGVDDGVRKPSMTIDLLNLMQQHGVKEVFFTPHVMEEMPNTPESLRKVYDDILPTLHGEPCKDITLHLAAENMLDGFFSLERAMQLPLPDDHLLVETSYFTPPYNMKDLLRQIMASGKYPLLAHPCRYQYMGEKDYEELRAMRIHFQLNIPAVSGLYGTEVQKKSFWLLDHGYYVLTGTDTHSLKQYQAFLDTKLPRKRVKQIEELLGAK
ncbi:MAG: capsular biosynthesis protein [Prevotella sp.]|nr:capsular biosynthesis protein [Prevotella sp.]